MITTIVATLSLTLPLADPGIGDIVQNKFEDIKFNSRILSANQSELAKINSDFGTQYRFKQMKISLKEPLMLRMETTIDDATVMMLVNGFDVTYLIPRSKVKSTQNMKKSIGRLQNLMEFGIMTTTLFNEIYDAKFVRNDRASGDYVFDLTYKAKYDDSSRSRIWVDPEKRYITKREWWGQGSNPRLKAVFVFEEPVTQKGVHFPTKVTVKNVEGKVGAVTKHGELVINSGLPDSIFKS